MASGLTRLELCNAALDMLIEASLSSLSDDRPVARWFGRNYDRIRDNALSLHTWSCVSKRELLPADVTKPLFGWELQYQLPPDFVRVHYLNHDGRFNGTPIAHEIDGDKILTNATAPLKLRYIYRETVEGKYDSLLCTLIAAMMAEELSHWMTGKSSFTQMAAAKRQECLRNARLFDSIQGSSQDVGGDDVIAARYR